jgi:uncharacterized low-complexity protein
MSSKSPVKPLSVALGTVFTLSLANTAVSNAADNPFAMESVSGAYMLLAESNSPEGKCAEGRCGCKHGKGGCGMAMMDSDADGSISREEFIKGHEAKFDQIDLNADGVIDPAEREAHMQSRHKGKGAKGACVQGKGGEG